MIEHQPERLQEVDGIGPKRAQKIVSGWTDQKVIREIMIFLHSHGVSTSRVVRISKTYGADAIQILSENPTALPATCAGLASRRLTHRRQARHREDGDDPGTRRHRLHVRPHGRC
jgi:exodeoxyribonuclease V alpha subunit